MTLIPVLIKVITSMHAMLGINAKNELKLYVNPFRKLNEVGTHHTRGEKFPQSVYDFVQTGNNPLVALADLQKYFDRHCNSTDNSRSGATKSKIRSKGKRIGD